jgi:hypothetical protein
VPREMPLAGARFKTGLLMADRPTQEV